MQDSYQEIFLSESQEYLKIISNCLVKLEDNPAESQSLNEIFRCTHTLKGMSATMGYEKIAQLSHQMEDLLDNLRSKNLEVSSEIINTLFTCVDILEQSIQDIRLKRDSNPDISACLAGLKSFLVTTGPLQEKTVLRPAESREFKPAELARFKEAKAQGLNVFKIEITLAKDCAMKEARAFLVTTHLKKMGEIVQAAPSLEDLKEGRFEQSFMLILSTKEKKEIIQNGLLNISDVEEVNVTLAEIKPGAALPSEVSYIKKIQSMRIPVQRLDRIMNLMGELTIAKIQLVQIVQSSKIKPLEEVSLALDHLTSVLQDEIMQTRLLPASYILEAFGRVVRDLSKKQNKEVELETTGSEIELDRIVLDEIGDPLVHLIRNAVDHGIESPEERIAAGKNPRGKIAIKVSRQKGQIFIELADDGRGIDFSAVGRLALEKGLISEQEAASLDEKKILALITLPGFSTAKEISDVSGRGVGLDVVKIKIESLGGRLDFETKAGLGTRFFLTLPLTLAIIKAMLVKVRQEMLAIPLMNIQEIIKIKREEIKLLQNFEVIRVRNKVIPIIRMDKELGILPASSDEEATNKKIPLIIIEYEKKVLGLMVSSIMGEQDIVVKPLPSFVKKTKGIAGATILGDGKVALILDIMSLG